MKKVSKFRLCALGLGPIFFTCSNAVHYFKLDNLTVLRDEDDHFTYITPINNPTNAFGFDLLNVVKNAISFTWDEKKFTIFALKYPSVYFDNTAFVDVIKFPLQFIECVHSMQFAQEFFNVNINLTNLKRAEDNLQKTINSLEKIHQILNDQVNRNPSYIKIIKEMVEINKKGVVLLENINILPDPQPAGAHIIDFLTPERCAYMSNNEYIQSLKNLKKERKKILKALEFFPTE